MTYPGGVLVAASLIIICFRGAPVSFAFSGVVGDVLKVRCKARAGMRTSSDLQGATNNNDPIGSYLDNLHNEQPPPDTSYANEQSQSPEVAAHKDPALKGNRFHKLAPDANALNAQDFRSQLKENMKADLERRRAEDPNRGNQPTRNYLENL